VHGRSTGSGPARQWRAALVHVRLDGVNFQRVFSHFLVNEQSRLQLLDSTGVALYSTLPAERYKSVVHGTYFSDKVRLGVTAQMPCHSCHQNGLSETVRESEVTTVAPLPGTDWTVTVREGTHELYAPMRETVYTSSALVCLIFGCFVGFYALLSRRVLRPMRDLVQTATALAGDRDATPLSFPASADEFAILSQSFAAIRAQSRPEAPSTLPPAPVQARPQPPPNLREELLSLVDNIAGSHAVRSVLLHLHGPVLPAEFYAARGITLRSVGAIGPALDGVAAGRVQVPTADLEARGIALEMAHDTRLFHVRRIRVADSLEGALWIGVAEGGEALGHYVGPTMALIAHQVQSLIERNLLYGRLKVEQEHKNRMLRHLFEAEADERKRIAREIHDETAQELTALLLVLETLPDGVTPHDRANLQRAKALVGQILDGLNRMVRRLRPAMLDDLGLIEAVRASGHNLMESAGIHFDLEVIGDDVRVSKDVENTVYRVFQEAATNVVRHAHARHVKMRLHLEPTRLMGWIQDDGKGMDLSWLDDVTARPRWGLLGVRERIVQAGGTVEFATPEGGGLRIVFEVPLGPGQEARTPVSPQPRNDSCSPS
jgi:signal transduction histidine kinase